MRGPAEPKDSFDNWFGPGKLLLLVGILIVISYPGIVFGTQAFAYRDAGLFTYPVAYYFRDCFWHGRLPLWNPYNNCGIPFLAQWNTLTLYPGSVIYLLLPMPWGLNVYLLAHIFLAALGMYRLSHLWSGTRFGASVAGLAFAWNGLSIQFLGWACHIAAFAWMPWVIYYCVRAMGSDGFRTIGWAAFAAACQMLTGAPETVLFTWLLIAAFFAFDVAQNKLAFWRGATRLLFVGILVCALSAAQLLPWFDLLANGDRSSASGGNDWSLPPWGLANFLVPLFHSAGSISGVFMQSEQQWVGSYYLGILPLLLAVVALWRGRRSQCVFLSVITLAAVLLSFGHAGFLLDVMRRCFPLLGFTRYPIKFIVIAIFSLSLLAGAGAAWLQTQTAATVKTTLRPAATLLALLTLLTLAVAFWFPFPTDSWNATWLNGLGRLLFLCGGFIMLWRTFAQSDARPALLGFGFLFVLGLDIIGHQPLQNPTVPARAYDARPPAMSLPPRLGESRAMLSPPAVRAMGMLVNSDPLQLYLGQRAELYENCNLLDRIPKTDGFFGIHLARQQKIAALVRDKMPPHLIEFLGVSQIALPRNLFKWQPQTNFMPIATIGQKPVFLEDGAALEALGTQEFRPREVVYLPTNALKSVVADGDPTARIDASDVRPDECLFKMSAGRRTMLVIAQAWYHCWKATVDGKPTPLYRANYGFQAVIVPEGAHEVRLVYVDKAFLAGAVISVITLILCIGGMRIKSVPHSQY
jgi:hypothetical protein